MGGLFRGMSSVLLREVPQFAVYYPWYEFARRKGIENGYFSPIIIQALAGGTAGVVQWLPPFYFFDVIHHFDFKQPLNNCNFISATNNVPVPTGKSPVPP